MFFHSVFCRLADDKIINNLSLIVSKDFNIQPSSEIIITLLSENYDSESAYGQIRYWIERRLREMKEKSGMPHTSLALSSFLSSSQHLNDDLVSVVQSLITYNISRVFTLLKQHKSGSKYCSDLMMNMLEFCSSTSPKANSLDMNMLAALILARNPSYIFDAILKLVRHCRIDLNASKNEEGKNTLGLVLTRPRQLRNLFSYYEFPTIVKILLDEGLDVNSTDVVGRNALFTLIDMSFMFTTSEIQEIANLLLYYRIDINCIDSTGHNVLMHLFSTPVVRQRGSLEAEMVNLMLSNGIDVNHVDMQGDNALLFFLKTYVNREEKFSTMKIFHLLLSSGVNLLAKNNNGMTAKSRIKFLLDVL